MSPSTTTSGITSTGNDVKLTVQAGGLSIGASLATGAGDLTLTVVGPVTQTATGVITGTGLQLLGSGTANLDQAANNVTTKIGRASCRDREQNSEVAVSLKKND